MKTPRLIGTMCKWSDPFSKRVLIGRGLDHNSLETLKSQRKNVSSDYSVLKARPSKKHWTKYNKHVILVQSDRSVSMTVRFHLHIASWGCIRSQGFGCSPIKAVRELGSERRETVRSLSYLWVGFTLRCFQRLSDPYIVAQLCPWQNNWCARGTSAPVLSY